MKRKIILLFLFFVVAMPVNAKSVYVARSIKTTKLEKSNLVYEKIDDQTKKNKDTVLDAAHIASLTARKYSRNRCWRAVKDALVVANAVSSRPTSKYAKDAGEELELKYGFKKLHIEDPFDAPVGSILVYGGRGAGHVEFRTTTGFVSDFINPRPSHRPLLGVYVKADRPVRS